MLQLYAVKTRLVKTGDDLTELLLQGLIEQGLELKDNDVLAFSSKIVSQAEGRLAKLSEIKPSAKARKLAQQFSLEPEFATLILQEADKIYGGVPKAVLTLKNGTLTANAGIDNKNAPEGYAMLWPHDIKNSARFIRNQIRSKTGKRTAVLIIDSGLTPLRIGTTGLALAVAGFKPIRDDRGEKDLYGKEITITRHAIADDLACMSHLLMGEAAEQTPIVLIRNAPVVFSEDVYDSGDMKMPFDECIFMKVFRECANEYESP